MHTLSRNDYRTLVLASLGGALEFYDFIIFVFFAVVPGVAVKAFPPVVRFSGLSFSYNVVMRYSADCPRCW